MILWSWNFKALFLSCKAESVKKNIHPCLKDLNFNRILGSHTKRCSVTEAVFCVLF
jgi:hypothetical protein